MVVDDDPAMRALLRDLLTRQGLRVCEETGSERVITLIASVRPDVVVLDQEMPGIDGLDLLARIRRRYGPLPVILVTAFGGPDVRAEALCRGAAGYLEKPFRVDRLLDILDAVTAAS